MTRSIAMAKEIGMTSEKAAPVATRRTFRISSVA